MAYVVLLTWVQHLTIRHYFMQLPPIYLLSALSHVPTWSSVPYPCTFHLYFGLGSVRPPLTFWAHGSLLHCHFLFLLRPLAPCRNTCLSPSLDCSASASSAITLYSMHGHTALSRIYSASIFFETFSILIRIPISRESLARLRLFYKNLTETDIHLLCTIREIHVYFSQVQFKDY